MEQYLRSFAVESDGVAALGTDFDQAWGQLSKLMTFADEEQRMLARSELARIVLNLYQSGSGQMPGPEAVVARYMADNGHTA